MCEWKKYNDVQWDFIHKTQTKNEGGGKKRDRPKN